MLILLLQDPESQGILKFYALGTAFLHTYKNKAGTCIILKVSDSLCALSIFFFLFFKITFIFSIIVGLQCSVNFLLYSKVTQSHIHIYILFSYILMLHHK